MLTARRPPREIQWTTIKDETAKAILKSLSEHAQGDAGRWKGQPASLHPVLKTCPTIDCTTDGS